MKHPAHEEGRAGWILLWLLGVPLPILFLLYVVRGCT
jgi:hypothetical protein